MDEFEYTCAPKTNAGRAAAWIALCLVTGSILYCFSFDRNALSPWFRVLGAAFFMVAVLMTVRFLGTRYVYRIASDSHGRAIFTVYELRGYFGRADSVKSSGAVCRVELSDISNIASSRDKKGIRALKRLSRSEKARIYNYCAADFVREYALIRIEDGDGSFFVKFSPDKKMKEIIKNR